jgi:cell wall assembly regulator SMI1
MEEPDERAQSDLAAANDANQLYITLDGDWYLQQRRAIERREHAETLGLVRWSATPNIAHKDLGPYFCDASPSEDEAMRDIITQVRTYLRESGNEAYSTSFAIDQDRAHAIEVGNPAVSVEDAVAAMRRALDAKRERAARYAHLAEGPQPGNDTASSSVEQQWQRLDAWLSTHVDAPRLNGPGADSAAISAAEAATAAWPDELTHLCALHNGIDELLPGMRLLSAAEIPVLHAALATAGSTHQVRRAAKQQAGTLAWAFLPQFIPFAHGPDGTYVVDTRPGPLAGCVTLWLDVDLDMFGPRWRSISAMLSDLAGSIETECPFDSLDQPLIENRQLQWRSRE